MARLNEVAPQGDQTKWTFEQLGGERKRLVLERKLAPLGRPRVGAVVADEIYVRQQEVHYDGGGPPTRHIFGETHEPIELNGRWSDHYLGAGETRKTIEFVKAFVADKQPVLVTWADNVRFQGLIERFKPEREGPHDAAWSMTILVDTDELLGGVKPEPTPLSPRELIGNPLADLKPDELTKIPDTLRVGPFEFLSQIIGILGAVGAELNDVAAQMRSFARAPLGLLKQFRASLQQFRTALIGLRNDLETLPAEYALETDRVADQAEWAANKSNFEVRALAIMQRLAEADRQASLAEQGQTKALHTARQGDTFESLAIKAYGSADRANDIREANGAPAGSDPVVGTLYRIPK